LTMRGAAISFFSLRPRSLTVKSCAAIGTPRTVVTPCASQSL